MAPVARELLFIEGSQAGILEPLQTATTLEGQILELKCVLEKNGTLPIILIGFSWGAMLSFIFTARYPEFVKKLILIGSAPYQEKYAKDIMDTRISRLGKEDWESFLRLTEFLNDPFYKKLGPDANKDAALCSFGKLISRVDAYNPLSYEDEVLACNYDIFKQVWEEASELRRDGKLLELGKYIVCPVVAIHGDYDPHPFEGVKEPLSKVLRNFRFILLKKCGHRPWIEKEAKKNFYEILEQEIKYK